MFTSLKNISILLLLIIFSSCTNQNQVLEAENSINSKDLEKHIIALSSDEFQGRKPFTIGEEKTTEYIANAFKKMGIEGAYNGSYFQNVPAVELKYSPDKSITINTKNGDITLELTKDYIAKTPHIKDSITIKNSEIIFAGYGIVAPEYGWDDYKNINVKDKIVLVLVNDPGFATQNNKLFRGNSMTYYGRWAYKYEEAARQGAKGILVIHSTKPAGYGWQVLTNTSGFGISIQTKNGNKNKCKLEGWITEDATKKLFEKSDLNFETLAKQAETSNFNAISLNCNLNLTIKTQLKFQNSKNVVGIIKGSKYPNECIVYSAHWDHFGIGPVQNGDSIYNGAMDNGTALAAFLETAKAFSKLKKKPERSVVFISVTAEETGLIGSKFYAQNGLFPPEKTIANLNYELLLPMGKMKDVTITGFGQSELDLYVKEAAKEQDRYIIEESSPENGMYFRSDHFSFAQVGIPSLFIKGWQDSRTKGKEWAQTQINNYWENAYHKPSDEYNPTTADLSGIVEDAKLFFKIGYKLANESSYPKWNEKSEFKAIREKSLKH
ncbi:M20/M25/M40 family metallo-hydrolase [Lutibacter sp.]|uniref:M20/M25/M40 family metallo-hydrolase n=1 Tax=Lutibacter sp. TaxID=1925666 RepID=UPI003568D8B7